MYAVVYTKEMYDEGYDEAVESKTKVYYCKKKALAAAYIKKRYNALVKSLENKERSNKIGSVFLKHIGSDSTFACIRYDVNTHSEYPYVVERFMTIRMSEILDLKNGPGLHVE